MLIYLTPVWEANLISSINVAVCVFVFLVHCLVGLEWGKMTFPIIPTTEIDVNEHSKRRIWIRYGGVGKLSCSLSITLFYIAWYCEVLWLVLAGQQEPELLQARKVYRTRRQAGSGNNHEYESKDQLQWIWVGMGWFNICWADRGEGKQVSEYVEQAR